ncbi:DNA circularization N-terminal domain-containing protein [Mesorhizobium sp. ASY16-5R]|uniref:DNA circularization N-terminal domain-containing protein n=1 Tax=Mesorhizobium sp. ASY16-5R TaxID=3445772 RepID=UPI003F9FE823
MTACRAWPDFMKPASFKGVNFEIESDTVSGGRRVVTHEYPSRESWDNEDLGRLHQRVAVNGYVHGDDCHTQAQRLMDKCSEPGAGFLDLSSRGAHGMSYARCLTCHSTFEADAMGRILIEMDFVLEAPGRGGLVSVILLAGSVLNANALAELALQALFGRTFDSLMRRFSPVSIVPAVARDAAAETIRLSAAALTTVRRSIRFKSTAQASKAELLIRQIAADATMLAYQGNRADLVANNRFVADQEVAVSGFSVAVSEIFRAIQDGAADKAELARVLEPLITFAPQPITSPYDCLSVRAEKALTADVAALVRRLALLHRCEAMIGITYGSRADALAAREAVAGGFSNELATLDDPDASAGMINARDAAVTYLSRVGAELPETVIVKLDVSMPAAVLATALYNDASRDVELVTRNAVSHPLYMPLEVEAIRPGAKKSGRRLGSR